LRRLRLTQNVMRIMVVVLTTTMIMTVDLARLISAAAF